MKKTLGILAMALMAGGMMFAQPRVSIGIGVGGYGAAYPPPAYAQYMPPCPGPDYTWVDGYWRGPVAGGYRVAPRYFTSPRAMTTAPIVGAIGSGIGVAATSAASAADRAFVVGRSPRTAAGALAGRLQAGKRAGPGGPARTRGSAPR